MHNIYNIFIFMKLMIQLLTCSSKIYQLTHIITSKGTFRDEGTRIFLKYFYVICFRWPDICGIYKILKLIIDRKSLVLVVICSLVCDCWNISVGDDRQKIPSFFLLTNLCQTCISTVSDNEIIKFFRKSISLKSYVTLSLKVSLVVNVNYYNWQK